MSKVVRTALASDNSRSYLKDSFTYKSVDGRCYKTDKKIPDANPHLSEKYIAYKKKQESTSMLEILRMEKFLESGQSKRLYKISSDDRSRIIEEYPIHLNDEGNRYEGPLEGIWEVLCSKFPERAARYPKGYKQAQYAMKYGDSI